MPPKEPSLEFIRRKVLLLFGLIHYYFISFKTLLSTFLPPIMPTETDLTNVPPEPISAEKVGNENASTDTAKEGIKSDGDAREDDAKIAKKMSGIIDPAIDRLKPILQTITEVSNPLPALHFFPLPVPV